MLAAAITVAQPHQAAAQPVVQPVPPPALGELQAALRVLARNPEDFAALAALLERIAERGPEHFYTGAAAENLVAAVRTAERNPAPMSRDDLATYQAVERPPLCGAYRGHRICGMGPPSSGATTVFAILEQLERFDLAALGPDDPRAWHLIAESMRLAYADREAHVGDPDFVAVPAAGLMDPDYLARRSALISPERAMARAEAGAPPGAPPRTAAAAAEVPSTSHFVAVDASGNVASYTSTIEGIWGSGLTVDGYFLNNELTDFSFVAIADGAPVANRVEGGKRPRSSMAPTIVLTDATGRRTTGVRRAGRVAGGLVTAERLVTRWRTLERALRLGRPLPYSPAAGPLSVAIGLIAVAAVIVLVRRDGWAFGLTMAVSLVLPLIAGSLLGLLCGASGLQAQAAPAATPHSTVAAPSMGVASGTTVLITTFRASQTAWRLPPASNRPSGGRCGPWSWSSSRAWPTWRP